MKTFTACIFLSALALPCGAEVIKDGFYEHHADHHMPLKIIRENRSFHSTNALPINELCPAQLQPSALNGDLALFAMAGQTTSQTVRDYRLPLSPYSFTWMTTAYNQATVDGSFVQFDAGFRQQKNSDPGMYPLCVPVLP